MTRYKSATWKPIATRSNKRLVKNILCLHTFGGGTLRGTWNYFNTGAGGRGVYSHFLIGGPWGGLDGVTWQAQDTDLRAAANLDGNPDCISVETEDNGVRPIAAWSPAQQTSIVNIMVEAHRRDGIPLQLIPDSQPGRRGVGYHRMGCNPYRVAGGVLWSTASGKDCPTQARIDQIPGMLDRARRIVDGEVDEETMTPELQAALADIRSAVGLAFNEARAAKSGVAQILPIVTALAADSDYDVIRSSDSPVVFAVVGDSLLHIPNQVALAPFGGLAAVEVVDPSDPRLTLPVVQADPEPEPAPGPPDPQ